MAVLYDLRVLDQKLELQDASFYVGLLILGVLVLPGILGTSQVTSFLDQVSHPRPLNRQQVV